MCETQSTVDSAKERVVAELNELNEKLVKLTSFLYGEKVIKAGLSGEMRCALREQVRVMQEYALILQRRLDLWGKTDEDIYAERRALDKVCGY